MHEKMKTQYKIKKDYEFYFIFLLYKSIFLAKAKRMGRGRLADVRWHTRARKLKHTQGGEER